MNFDIKDVKSWANRHDAKVGDKGYFSNNIQFLDDIVCMNQIGVIEEINENDVCCFKKQDASNFGFFLPLDAIKKENKMNFDIKDVKSWSNRYDVKIGDEGYFFYDIDKLRNFENEYIKPVKSKLSAIRDNCATCFQIDNGCDGYNVFPFFLPADAVKDKSEKRYRPFKDAYELYKFFISSW